MRKFRRYHHSPFYKLPTALREVQVENLGTINPFTPAYWTERIQTTAEDGESGGWLEASQDGAVRIAINGSARNDLVDVGGVVEIPTLAQGGQRLEEFLFTLGMRTGQNPFSGELAAAAYALRFSPRLRP